VVPWRWKFSRLYVLFICYDTAVEHRSLLNRSGIWKFNTVFSFMRQPHTWNWHATRQRYRNGHPEIRKMKIKEANLFNTVGCCIVYIYFSFSNFVMLQYTSYNHICYILHFTSKSVIFYIFTSISVIFYNYRYSD
jgi:hypothetical protein